MNDMHKMLNVCVCVCEILINRFYWPLCTNYHMYLDLMFVLEALQFWMCATHNLSWVETNILYHQLHDTPISRRQVHILNCFLILPFMFSFATMDNLSYAYSFASITISHLLDQLSMVSHSFSLNTLSIVMHYHINTYKYCCYDTYIT
jgi:hypothetical protein